ncbi:MAG: isoprenylcysteine carboxylmethyltransferase family protein [Candidatus Methanoperedens sp.]|nr:MAG: isoprenylcysteine carboxylmethyltransferase family protein [Candidatus Methanoperedens sp.]
MSVITTFVLYFFAFAFIHSLLATDYIKNIAKTKLKGKFRFYRIIYNILSFLIAAPAFFVWLTSKSLTPLVYNVPGWLSPLLLILRPFAVGLFAYAALQKDLLEFAGLRQGKSESKLITDGVYRIVRHPLYLAGIILIFTKPEMTLLDLTAAALVSIYFITGAYIEERRLVSTFGDRYRKYQQEVSMFIPVKWVIKRILAGFSFFREHS